MSEGRISPREAEELAACFRAHARDLFGHACALTRGDQALAHDLVQAAFEAAAGAWQILGDLTEEQRQALLRIYLSFRHENEAQAESDQATAREPDGPAGEDGPPSAGTIPTPVGRGPTSVAG